MSALTPKENQKETGKISKSKRLRGGLSKDEKKIAFKIISTPSELKKIFSLRYQIFCKEMKVVDEKDCPSGLEYDDYDTCSIHTVIVNGEEIVAYTRLVQPSGQFPIEKRCDIPPVFKRSKAIEVSKAFVIKKYRGGNAIWLLFNSIYSFCQKQGFESILSFLVVQIESVAKATMCDSSLFLRTNSYNLARV